jgi:hypothetical protein
MSAVREYRENADECFTRARTARSDREREIFQWRFVLRAKL